MGSSSALLRGHLQTYRLLHRMLMVLLVLRSALVRPLGLGRVLAEVVLEVLLGG